MRRSYLLMTLLILTGAVLVQRSGILTERLLAVGNLPASEVQVVHDGPAAMPVPAQLPSLDVVPPPFADAPVGVPQQGFPDGAMLVSTNGRSSASTGDRFSSPPPAFGNQPVPPGLPSVSRPELFESSPAFPLELMDEVTHILYVSRKAGTRHELVRHRLRLNSSEVEFSSPPPQVVGEGAMAIYATDLKLEYSADGALTMTSAGKVSIRAPQSIVRGRELKYADGELHLQDCEVWTPDAKLETGSIKFAFEIGHFRIQRVTQPPAAPVEAENEPAAEDPFLTDGSPEEPPTAARFSF